MQGNRQSSDSEQELPVFVSGGLQQYLIRQNAAQQLSDGVVNCFASFCDLPDSLTLHIFSFLGPEDLCRISRVCQRWYAVSCDDNLWKLRLKCDVHSWNVIGNNTNPDFYTENDSTLTHREIYLRCSPIVCRLSKQQNDGFHRLSELLRSFLPKKPPKLAMFGPGLETSTSGIVRKIISGQSNLFTVLRMFPGQFEGVGSGFTLRTADDSKLTLGLIMLYTATQTQRENQTAAERAQHNRLMMSSQPAEDELQPAIKDLCRTLDGLVYVVDATVSADDIAVGRSELAAMLNEQWMPAANPVVILSCVPDESCRRLSAIKVIRLLRLTNFNRPWQVHDCVVESMEGVASAFQWAVQTCYRK